MFFHKADRKRQKRQTRREAGKRVQSSASSGTSRGSKDLTSRELKTFAIEGCSLKNRLNLACSMMSTPRILHAVGF
jgi:hypothetical protein